MKSATIIAGNASINEGISSDLFAGVSKLSLFDKAKIKGNLTYWSDENAYISKGASIEGKIIKQNPPQVQPNKIGLGISNFFKTIFKIVQILDLAITLLVGILLIRFLPVFSKKASDTILEHPKLSALIGFLVLFLTPILSIMLAVTLVGIPIAFFIFMLFLLYILLGKIFISYTIGRKIAHYTNQNLQETWSFIIGVITLSILAFIPIIGGIISLIALVLGIGGVILVKKEYYINLRAKKLL